MLIREIEIFDIDQIRNIYNFFVKNTIVSFEEVPVSLDEMKARVYAVKEAKLPWLIIEDEGRVVGYAYSSPWSNRSAYRYSAGVSVYMLEGCTGQELGYQLYCDLFDRLKEQKIHAIMGGIALPNPASIALHEKMGMSKVAHFKKVGFKFGNWVDVAFWQLRM